jgi:hypothetical protein
MSGLRRDGPPLVLSVPMPVWMPAGRAQPGRSAWRIPHSSLAPGWRLTPALSLPPVVDLPLHSRCLTRRARAGSRAPTCGTCCPILGRSSRRQRCARGGQECAHALAARMHALVGCVALPCAGVWFAPSKGGPLPPRHVQQRGGATRACHGVPGVARCLSVPRPLYVPVLRLPQIELVLHPNVGTLNPDGRHDP